MSELDRIEREVLATRELVRVVENKVQCFEGTLEDALVAIGVVMKTQEQILQTQAAILELLGEPKTYPASSGGSITVK